MKTIFAVVLSALVAIANGSPLYLPGVAPHDYEHGELVEVRVNKVLSSKTQMPYRYNSLPVCPTKRTIAERENLGEVLVGDRIEASDYDLKMMEDEYCKVLCRRHLNKNEARVFAELIADDYSAMWIVDNLPAAVQLHSKNDPTDVVYRRGFELGETVDDGAGGKSHFLYNHIVFLVKYNKKDAGKPNAARIVGVEVEPFSVRHQYSGKWEESSPPKLATCNADVHVERSMTPMQVDEPTEVIFTYDVLWQESDISWSHRWDVFLSQSKDRDIHWYSIANSVVISLFLSGMIAMILVRALYRDIARYNDDADPEDKQDDSGWKLVHGDVFRPPEGFFGPMFLAVFVGSGMQLLLTSVIVVFFAALGLLSPANRGGLLTAILVIYALLGSFAGYTSARVYKMFQGKAWRRNALLTSVAFPGTAFAAASVINSVVWSEHSSAALPASTFVTLLVLWFLVSVPLVFVGAYFGFTAKTIEQPVKTKTTPRLIPPQPLYVHPLISFLVGGILPFGAVFIELYFVMSSVWLHQIYYVYGFLAIVLVVTIITCGEVSIVFAYFQLCAEDYNWWWRSFLTSGASAFYLFAYSILYFATKLTLTKASSVFLFFAYMTLTSWAFFLLTGSIGFVSTFYFVRTIFSAIKVD